MGGTGLLRKDFWFYREYCGTGLTLHEKEDCASEVIEFSVTSFNGFDFLDLAVDSFCSGIGLFTGKLR